MAAVRVLFWGSATLAVPQRALPLSAGGKWGCSSGTARRHKGTSPPTREGPRASLGLALRADFSVKSSSLQVPPGRASRRLLLAWLVFPGLSGRTAGASHRVRDGISSGKTVSAPPHPRFYPTAAAARRGLAALPRHAGGPMPTLAARDCSRERSRPWGQLWLSCAHGHSAQRASPLSPRDAMPCGETGSVAWPEGMGVPWERRPGAHSQEGVSRPSSKIAQHTGFSGCQARPP